LCTVCDKNRGRGVYVNPHGKTFFDPKRGTNPQVIAALHEMVKNLPGSHDLNEIWIKMDHQQRFRVMKAIYLKLPKSVIDDRNEGVTGEDITEIAANIGHLNEILGRIPLPKSAKLEHLLVYSTLLYEVCFCFSYVITCSEISHSAYIILTIPL